LRPVTVLRAFLHAITALRQKLNVPHTLRDFKVDDSKRDLIGDMAMSTRPPAAIR
jgi:alcohol dehydrogenase class IV